MIKKYAIADYTTAEEIKNVRKELNMTQKEFAKFIGSSKPTVERWECSDKKISGPIILLLKMLKEYPEMSEKLMIPPKQLPIRMWYMYKNEKCTLIDVDDAKRVVQIKNYTDRIMFRAFGTNVEPTYDDYLVFLEDRCFPRTRDRLKLVLDDLGIPFYDPFLIVEKTKGKMAEDDFWIDIER